MFNFLKKIKKEKQRSFVEQTIYYNINGEIYRVELRTNVDVDDLTLSREELFNKYSFYVCKYNLEYQSFEDWNFYEYHFHSFEEFFEAYDINGNDLQEIEEENLEFAIQKLQDDFEKKFNDFKVDDTIYTNNAFDICNPQQLFQSIAKVKKKLIDESRGSNHVRSFILEIEYIDGDSAEKKRKFIKFYDFINKYKPGCNIKVVDSNDGENTIEDYFKQFFN